MSERRSAISRTLMIGTVALAPPFLSLGLLLLFIWALTAGGGYFWPMWPYWALVVIIALRAVHVWDHARPQERRRQLDALIGYGAVW